MSTDYKAQLHASWPTFLIKYVYALSQSRSRNWSVGQVNWLEIPRFKKKKGGRMSSPTVFKVICCRIRYKAISLGKKKKRVWNRKTDFKSNPAFTVEGGCQWIPMGICAVQLPHKWPWKIIIFEITKMLNTTNSKHLVAERFHDDEIRKKIYCQWIWSKTQAVKAIPII